MPLPPSGPREELHLRRIDLRGYRREDGMFEIDAHLTDTKTHPFQRWGAPTAAPPGTALHDMWVRIVVDQEFVVRDIVAVSDASPFPACPEATAAMSVMKGERIGAGWTRKVKERLGGRHGCTHLAELLLPLATVAYQTMAPVRRARGDVLDASGRPVMIDSCHAYASDGEAVKMRWPAFYTGSAGDSDADRA